MSCNLCGLHKIKYISSRSLADSLLFVLFTCLLGRSHDCFSRSEVTRKEIEKTQDQIKSYLEHKFEVDRKYMFDPSIFKRPKQEVSKVKIVLSSK